MWKLNARHDTPSSGEDLMLFCKPHNDNVPGNIIMLRYLWETTIDNILHSLCYVSVIVESFYAIVRLHNHFSLKVCLLPCRKGRTVTWYLRHCIVLLYCFIVFFALYCIAVLYLDPCIVLYLVIVLYCHCIVFGHCIIFGALYCIWCIVLYLVYCIVLYCIVLYYCVVLYCCGCHTIVSSNPLLNRRLDYDPRR